MTDLMHKAEQIHWARTHRTDSCFKLIAFIFRTNFWPNPIYLFNKNLQRWVLNPTQLTSFISAYLIRSYHQTAHSTRKLCICVCIRMTLTWRQITQSAMKEKKTPTNVLYSFQLAMVVVCHYSHSENWKMPTRKYGMVRFLLGFREKKFQVFIRVVYSKHVRHYVICVTMSAASSEWSWATEKKHQREKQDERKKEWNERKNENAVKTIAWIITCQAFFFPIHFATFGWCCCCFCRWKLVFPSEKKKYGDKITYEVHVDDPFFKCKNG